MAGRRAALLTYVTYVTYVTAGRRGWLGGVRPWGAATGVGVRYLRYTRVHCTRSLHTLHTLRLSTRYARHMRRRAAVGRCSASRSTTTRAPASTARCCCASTRRAATISSPTSEPWYLHGSALLRRAQAMRLRAVEAAETAGNAGNAGNAGTTAAAGGGASGSPSADAAGGGDARGANGATKELTKHVSALGAEWQRSGSAAIGRRVRRFFALHGMTEGTVVAWQPPVTAEEGGGEAEEAVWHVIHDDGDGEDLEAKSVTHRPLHRLLHRV